MERIRELKKIAKAKRSEPKPNLSKRIHDMYNAMNVQLNGEQVLEVPVVEVVAPVISEQELRRAKQQKDKERLKKFVEANKNNKNKKKRIPGKKPTKEVPKEVKPSEAKIEEVKPSEAKAEEVKIVEVKPTEVVPEQPKQESKESEEKKESDEFVMVEK